MLSIRLQRTGRKSHAMFRIVVQDSRRTPTSGKIVAALGSYNPHSKDLILDIDKAKTFLKNGANPTPRIVSLFKLKKIEMPVWVEANKTNKTSIKHPEKLRKNQPKVEKEVVEELIPTPLVETENVAEEPTPVTEAPAEDVVVEDTKPAESTK